LEFLIFGILSTDNNIKKFTAADIEKYHKGSLSSKERHDLEKAALDDPFLADALEGYAVADVNHAADIDELKKRLANKVEAGKVINMKGGKSSFPLLRVAALVIIIAGAGLLAKQFLFTNQSKNIAQAETKKTELSKINDSTVTITGNSGQGLIKTNSETIIVKPKQNGNSKAFTPSDNTSKGTASTETVDEISIPNSNPAVSIPEHNNQASNTTAKTEDEKNAQYKITGSTETKPGVINNQELSKEVVKDKGIQNSDNGQGNKSIAPNRKVADNQNYRSNTNTFRGRVTDANNVGLPFARVYNPADNNAGTYTDVAGNFNLTYPDTVLSVQVKSVGFENTTVQLRNNVSNNQVILLDDKSLSEVVISNQKPNAAARNRDANKTLEEPEPADGWENYDTYIVNNLNPPDEIKTKQNSGGQVEVSFEVDKNGNPINIKVEKSLGSKCDQEAIRLIKEGPKWKGKAKKGRTTVSVPFDKSL
jgi:TonB family protein